MEKISLEFTDFLDPLFQELLLAQMVNSRDFTARSRGLVKPGYFSATSYKKICEALFDYWDKFQDVPNQDMLVIGVSKLVDTPRSMGAYAELVGNLYNYSADDLNTEYLQEQLVFFCQRAEAAFTIGTAYGELREFDIDQTSRELQRIQMIPSTFTDLGLEIRKDWRTVFDEDLRPSFPTGYHTLDATLRGGMKGGELVVFMAPLKRGKSLILINIGKSLFLMGNLVCHYTLEMYKEDVLRRYLGSITNKPVNSIQEYGEDLYKKFSQFSVYTEGDIIVKEFPAKTATVSMIEAHMHMVTAKYGRSPIPIIDYADLLLGDSRKEEWKEIPEIYVHLRNLGRKFNVPIISASQTNAEGFKSEKLDATHQSGATRKGFAVDAMFGVEQNSSDYALNRFRMVPFLNRNERKDLETYWQADYTSSVINEVTKEEYDATISVEEFGESLQLRSRAFYEDKAQEKDRRKRS